MSKIIYINIGRRLKINIGFFALLIYSFICGFTGIFVISYITAAIHETAHIIAARRRGIEIMRVEIMPFGLNAKLAESIIKDPNSEIIVAAAGPAVNLISACILLTLEKLLGAGELLRYAANINIALCAVNLIPALPLDGGRIFKASLSKFCGTVRAYNSALKISRIFIIVILAAAAAVFLICSFNFSLILIGIFMLSNLSYEQRLISTAALREFLYTADKVNEEHSANIKPVAVSEKTPARLILKKLNFSRYYIAVILDEKMKIKKTVTESEIINALVKKGVLISVDEV